MLVDVKKNKKKPINKRRLISPYKYIYVKKKICSFNLKLKLNAYLKEKNVRFSLKRQTENFE